MIELKLDAFLLTPIQRICQYPLQLNELFKYTSYDHKDYQNIQQALNTMRDVANYINERKRRMEYIEIIQKWQHTVEGWQVRDAWNHLIYIIFFNR
jgi:Rho guanine nucleotide exchange factor 4